MLLAFVVYISLLLVMLVCARLSVFYITQYKLLYWNILLYFPLLFGALLIGLRDGVGLDCLVYRNVYLSQEWSDNLQFEPAYSFLNVFLYKLGVPYYGLFITIAFIQFLFLYKTFQKIPFLLPWGLFCFFVTGIIFSQLNIMRQVTGFLIFSYAIQYIYQKSFFKYSLCLLFAGMFHYSLLVLLPFYFIVRLKWGLFDKVLVQLMVYGFIFLTAPVIFDAILDTIRLIFMETHYANYAHTFGVKLMRVNSGYGIMATNIANIILITSASKLSLVYKEYGFIFYYRLFFLGIILSTIFGLDMVLARIAFPLTSLRFVILAFFLHDIFIRWKRYSIYCKCIGLLMFFLYILMFVANIVGGADGCTPYRFIFI